MMSKRQLNNLLAVVAVLTASLALHVASGASMMPFLQRKHLLAEEALKLNRPSLQLGLDVAERRGMTKRTMPGFLRIHSAPASEVVVSVNENMELRCEVSASPPATIQWLKNGDPITEDMFDQEENTNKIVESEPLSTEGVVTTTSVLKIDCADFDTEGIYTCAAESLIERVISSTYVHVEGMSPFNATACRTKHQMEASGARDARISMWFSTYIETQGRDAVLACRVVGSPRPRVFWLNGEGNMITNSQKYQLLPNGDLKIRRLTWEDMGGYTCVAENKHGRDEAFTFLYPLRPES